MSTTAKDRYKALREKMSKLREEAKDEAKKYFSEESKQLFDQFPQMESFGWPQYTPHFNDGEACEFSAHTDSPDINGEAGYELEYKVRKTTWDKKPNPDYLPDIAPMFNAVRDFLQAFSDDDLQDMFGDHCRVVVTRQGTETEEYKHD